MLCAKASNIINQLFDELSANSYIYTYTYYSCTNLFNTLVALQKHERDFHSLQQYIQSVLGTNKSTIRAPRPTTTTLVCNSQVGLYKCTHINPLTNKPCNIIFLRLYNLTQHQNTIHNSHKQKVRYLIYCEEKTFSCKNAFTRHMYVVHPNVELFRKRGCLNKKGNNVKGNSAKGNSAKGDNAKCNNAEGNKEQAL